jgi:hypothetical protein
MSGLLKSKMQHAFKVAVTFAPWVMSMYALYWLQYGEIWTTETAHRGKISVAILATGMALSFLVHSHFSRRGQK